MRTAEPVVLRSLVLRALQGGDPRTLARALPLLDGAPVPPCRYRLPHTWRPCGDRWHARLGYYASRAYWCPRCREAFEVSDAMTVRRWQVARDAPGR